MISLAQRAPREQPLFLLADDRESQYTSRLLQGSLNKNGFAQTVT
jgi:hypothetical protein